MANPWEMNWESAAPAAPWEMPWKEEPNATVDVAKQVGSGLVTGLESMVTWPAHAANALSPVGNYLARKAEEYGIGRPDEQAAQDRETRRNLIAKQGGSKGIRQYLPEPETTAGQYARTAANFVPQAVAMPGRVATNAAIGAASGLSSEGAKQVAEKYAPTLAPAASVIAPVLTGGFGALLPNRAARRATSKLVPTTEDLEQAKTAGYKAVDDLGVTIDPTTVSKALGGIRNDLEKEFGAAEQLKGVDKTLAAKEATYAPAATGEMSALTGVQPAAKAPVAYGDLDELRKQLGNLTRSQDGTERAIAYAARHRLDDFVEGLASTPQSILSGDVGAASALLSSARANTAAMKRAEAVEGRSERAGLNAQSRQSTGKNIDDTTRQSFKSLLLRDMKGGASPAEKMGFDPEEITQINRIVRGEPIDNVLRKLAGSGLTHGVVGGGGVFETLRTGDPRYLVPYAAIRGLKGLSGARTNRQARILDEMVRSRSPAGYQAFQVTAPPQRLSTGTTGALMGLQAGRNLLLDDPNQR